MCSQRSLSEPGLQPEAGTFLSRAMSQGNATFGPLWTPTYIDIDCDSTFKNVDPATTPDPDDCVHEELQVYTQVSTTQQVGYLIAEYDVSFEEPVYQPHSSVLPISTGPGVRVTLADQNLYAVGDDIVLTDPSNVLGFNFTLFTGQIYRMVFDLQGSTAPTGATFVSWINASVAFKSAVATSTAITTPFPLIGGTVLYGVVASNSLELYTSLEAAIGGNGSGQLFAKTATTVSGSYNFDVALVRYGVTTLPQIQ